MAVRDRTREFAHEMRLAGAAHAFTHTRSRGRKKTHLSTAHSSQKRPKSTVVIALSTMRRDYPATMSKSASCPNDITHTRTGISQSGIIVTSIFNIQRRIACKFA
jgi:hypothetical protein